MKIKMLMNLAGPSVRAMDEGHCYEVADEFAEKLIAAGAAERVSEETKAKPIELVDVVERTAAPEATAEVESEAAAPEATENNPQE